MYIIAIYIYYAASHQFPVWLSSTKCKKLQLLDNRKRRVSWSPYVICNLRLFFPYFQKCGDGISKMCQNYDRWNPKLHHMFMVVSNGWWTKSLLGKWLGISKHPFTTGCLGFQVYVWFLKTPCGQKDMPHSKKTQLQPPPEYLTPQALTKATRISYSMCFSSEFPCVLFVVMIF